MAQTRSQAPISNESAEVVLRSRATHEDTRDLSLAVDVARLYPRPVVGEAYLEPKASDEQRHEQDRRSLLEDDHLASLASSKLTRSKLTR
jgi:hypothetical protein